MSPLASDFSTYAGRRERPFALPLTLAGAGCHHGSRRCLLCYVLSEGYAASMRWAEGLTYDDEPYDDDGADMTLLEAV